jgi:inhibitor of KinA sporulation pathway (predicted exonuclease)
MKKYIIPRNFSILDTEYTAWKGSRERNWSNANEYKEIIEIGIINFINLKECNKLNLLVLPKRNPILSRYIKKLTGINNTLLSKEGINFVEALNLLSDFYKKNPGVIFTFGDDAKVIEENIYLNNLNFDSNKLNFFNIRPWIEKQLSIEENTIDSSGLNYFLGVKSTVKHRAINDCRNIFNAIKCIHTGGIK